MIRGLFGAVICAVLAVQVAVGQSNWTGAVDDNWSNAGNWSSGVPSTANVRARIAKTSDTGNWPVVKTGANIVQNSRIQAPFSPAALGSNLTTFSRLTVESGATLTVGDDFLFGENDGTASEQIVGSLTVAGTISVAERIRFAHNKFTTMEVDVTGSLIQTVSNQDFRLATGSDSLVDFAISGNGQVVAASEFEMGDGASLSIADTGRLVLIENLTMSKADIIELITGYAVDGLIYGIPNYHSEVPNLIQIGYGLGYLEGPDRITFMVIPEPATGVLLAMTAIAGIRFRRRGNA